MTYLFSLLQRSGEEFVYEVGDLIYLSRGTTDIAIKASFPPLPWAFWVDWGIWVRKVALSLSLSSRSNTVVF